MDNKKFVEIEVQEKAAEKMPCFDGCQRAAGSPTGG